MGAPEPEEIYERTREEGARRLERPILEVISTALAAGFDIIAGVVALVLVEAQLEHVMGTHAAHFVGSIAFGIGFVFLIVGRGELFTENFLVPIAGLENRGGGGGRTWGGLLRLWGLSPIFNVIGGTVIIFIVTAHGVLPKGTGTALKDVAQKLHANHPLTLFLSAVFAGALITAMT